MDRHEPVDSLEMLQKFSTAKILAHFSPSTNHQAFLL
jgi:hypothetical protein